MPGATDQHDLPFKLKDPSLLHQQSHISGKWTEAKSGKRFDVIDPGSGKPFASCPNNSHEDVDDAVAAALAAFQKYRKVNPRQRAKCLLKWHDLIVENKDDLATIVTYETGKPLAEAHGELVYALGFPWWFAGEAERISGEIRTPSAPNRRLITIKKPIGVCAALVPWNFPIAMIMRKCGAALAAGCTMVIKPSPETPLSVLALVDLALRAGFEPGCLNVLTTDLDNTPGLSEALCKHPDVKKVTFTGSTRVGKLVARHCSEGLKKVTLELGGNCPFIIFDDANLDQALEALMLLKWRHAGQACISANRVYVQQGVFQKFQDMLVKKTAELRQGHGANDGTTIGPVTTPQGIKKVEQQLEDAVNLGGKVLLGGKRPKGTEFGGGFFFEPTIVSPGTPQMLQSREETFGPLLVLYPFETEEQVVKWANDTSMGLASYAFSRDFSRNFRLLETLEAGMVGINSGNMSAAESAFGGIKESGYGKESGKDVAVSEYCVTIQGTITLEGSSPRSDSSPAQESKSVPENLTLFEAFEWYCRADQQHWRRLEAVLPSLKAIGVDLVWLPPGCKASHVESNGYDCYDLYDLGEFHQKGHVATKWGSKADLVACCAKAKELGVGMLWDAVLNHKASADYTQVLQAVEVSAKDRRKVVGKREIEAWLGWDFEGRGGKYSEMKYNAAHFNATDYDQREVKSAIYRLDGKQWAKDVDRENGNFDWLLLNNYDLAREDVRDDFAHWAAWIGDELGLKGMRYDAAKHMSRDFMKDHARRLDAGAGRDWFLVAEYCTANLETLVRYIDEMQGRIHLFDFPLHGRLVAASHAKDPDLRLLLQDTLLERRPLNTVCHVANHDSQARDQEFETTVAAHFVPMAYALILLHASSHQPCVFFGDLFGVRGPGEGSGPTCGGKLPKLTLMRKLYAYGPQQTHFDSRHCVGFTRAGHPSRSAGAGLAVLMAVGREPARKKMHVGKHHAGERWTDALGSLQQTVEIDDRGFGDFPVGANMVCVWVDQQAQGREQVDALRL